MFPDWITRVGLYQAPFIVYMIRNNACLTKHCKNQEWQTKGMNQKICDSRTSRRLFDIAVNFDFHIILSLPRSHVNGGKVGI